MGQVTIGVDKETRDNLRAAREKYALQLGLKTLSLNQFIQMLVQYWLSSADQEDV